MLKANIGAYQRDVALSLMGKRSRLEGAWWLDPPATEGSGHAGEAIGPADVPEFIEVGGWDFGEIAVGVHQADEFAEAFLSAGIGTIVGRLTGWPVRAGPQTQLVGGGGFPGIPFVDLFVFIPFGSGIAEVLAKRLVAEGLVFRPQQVADLMHGEPVACESGRIIAHREAEWLISDFGASNTFG
jgi:hypothetical protein